MLHEVKLVADVCLLAEGQVLLVRYSDSNKYDHQSGWFLPDDYLQALEHPAAAALRLLSEQLSIDATVEPLPSLGFIESFRGGDRSWHLVFHFKLELEQRPALSFDDNIAEARWFSLDALPASSEVAHYGWALGTIEELGGRLEAAAH